MTLFNRFSRVLLIVVLAIVLAAAGTFSVYKLFPQKHLSCVNKYCSEYGVSPYIVFALIKAESNFNPDAQSSASAKGLMQLTDATFKFCLEKMGLDKQNTDIFDPELNIRVGIWYFKTLLDKYDGNEKNAIAAYNAGLSNVDKWLSSRLYSVDGKTLDTIPFKETDRHIQKISRYQKIYELLY